MITLYTTSSCSSCRKAKKWLDEQGIEYKEINIFVKQLTVKELSYILQRTENGTDDIISKRSKVIMEGKHDIDSMTIDELLQFLVNNPSAIRRPIIIDERHFQVGYNDDEIRVFIPRELRDLNCDTCEFFDTCEQRDMEFELDAS